MRLDALLQDTGLAKVKDQEDLEITGIAIDSRKVADGFLFAAMKGSAADGHLFIPAAKKRGAVAVLYNDLSIDIPGDMVGIPCLDVRSALGAVAKNFYGDGSKSLKLIGITGTNGKTTVASIAYNLFKGLGYKVGLISTIEIKIGDRSVSTKLTTPDVVSLHSLICEMESEGCEYVFMEASSHAIIQERIGGLHFAAGVFTNITHDHLDYHGTFKNYIKAKKMFFDRLPESSFAVVNADDKNGKVMVQNCPSMIRYYSLRSMTDYKAKVISADIDSTYLDINGHKLITRLIGRYNVYNLLAVYALADLFTVASADEVVRQLSALTAPAGRLEWVLDRPRVIVDYAHTPDALKNILQTIKSLVKTERITTVIGCGGNRDQEKRPKMAKVACDYSDYVVLTSDNPRDEEPLEIIEQMKSGLDKNEYSKTTEIVDRETAIKQALEKARSMDIVLIAGKGHEAYQEIKGKRRFFSDQEVVKKWRSSKDI